MGKNYAPKNQDDFILGGKAADLWLRTADMCANKKVIPVRYRYTTGTGMMQSAEAICGAIEEANLIDLERDDPRKRLALQRAALRECRKMERRIRKWEVEYAQGKITRKKIMQSYQSWEAHAKHGDTRQLRIEMRNRLEASLRRAEEQRRLAGIGGRSAAA